MNLADMTIEQREAVAGVMLRLHATIVEEAIKAADEDTHGMLAAAHLVSVEAGAAMRSIMGGES